MAADSSTAAPSPTTPFTSRTPAPQAPSQPALPPSLGQLPPHLFDIIPATERLLSRLLLPAPGLQADGPGSSSSGAAPAANQSVPEHKRHLEIQHLDQAANSVRMQISRARAGVAALPDVDRTVEEQREEIEWLEGRIAQMQVMMDKVREDFAVKSGDTVAG